MHIWKFRSEKSLKKNTHGGELSTAFSVITQRVYKSRSKSRPISRTRQDGSHKQHRWSRQYLFDTGLPSDSLQQGVPREHCARRRSPRGGQAVPEAAKVAQQAGDRLQKNIIG